MNRLAIWMSLLFLVACGSSGGGGTPDVGADVTIDVPADVPADGMPDTGQDTAPDTATDTAPDTGVDAPPDLPAEVPAVDPCGNKTCDPGETCWNCPADCECRCGDGVCTHGEACLNCPSDCDCTTLGATPPMGWNSWNKFACDISDALAKETADAMVSTGLKDAGYRFLNLDDCWQVARDAQGEIVPDATRFANGMKSLGDYVHEKGLGFGVYTCAGSMTCQERPGSLDYEAQDMLTYASWGVDYIKVDWCFAADLNAKTQYGKFRDGIAASGRDMVLSLCNWGVQEPWIWGAGAGQLWRTTGDISDGYFSMLLNLEQTEPHAAYAGPGHWNDPDMLEIGNGGMTEDQYRSHMSLWAILSAPLIAGNDLRTMDATTKELLTNPEVIAVDQDALGLQGVRVQIGDDYTPDVWTKPLAHPGWRAVVVFNKGEENFTFDLASLDLGLAAGETGVRDLWARTDLGTLGKTFPVDLVANGARMFRIAGTEKSPAAGQSYVSDNTWIYMAGSRGPVERDRSNGGTPARDGKALSIRNKVFSKGIGAYAGSIVIVPIGGRCTAFQADVGVDDDAAGAGTISFEVWADGTRLFDSGVMSGTDQSKPVTVDLSGKMLLKLVTTAGADSESGDYADWADARITCR